MTLLNRLMLLFAVLGLSVGCDQATKQIANATLKGEPMRSFLGDTFRLTWATNEGAFLSLGANLPSGMRFGILTVAVGLLLLGIVIFTATNAKLNSGQVSGYAMIAGGGLATTVKAGAATTRLASTATTGGLGNSVISTIENVGAVVLSIIAILIPAMIGLLLLAALLAVFAWRRSRRRREELLVVAA